jgi:membrane-associated protease RseP (regulator of RpoE activity)
VSTSTPSPSAPAAPDFPSLDSADRIAFRPAEARDVRRPAQGRPWLNALLLLATIGTTTLVGQLHYAGFVSAFGNHAPPATLSLTQGLWYSATIIAILGCHELGHYLACRYYRVDASLPYFLPVPPMFLTGTLGAFIRIREPFRSKRALFDIGVAGPLAGFAVTVPALVIGVLLSNTARLPPAFTGYDLGEPLLFKAVIWAIWGTIPAGYSVNLHPVAFAAWFGLLATALNLIPIGQLDGGHLSYAVFGRRSLWVTYGAVGCMLLLILYSASWIVWTLLTVAMLYFFGPRHPRTPDEHLPLDRGRLLVALLAAAIFAVSFTPAPIEIIQLLPR